MPHDRRRPAVGTAPRVAVLWNRMSGYFGASLRALVERGADVVVVHPVRSGTAPFESEALTGGLVSYQWATKPEELDIEQLLCDFEPDVLLVSSWNIGAYRRIAREWHGRTLRVLGMDNQWWGTAKQWAGVASSRWLVRPAYDAVLLAGERQAEFARRLGFTSEQMIWGLYSADGGPFEKVAHGRDGELPPRTFLYVGRLVQDKAIDVLADGYRRYRTATDAPWPLIVAGDGPQAGVLRGIDGVEMLGFVQPDRLPGVFARAGALVLPSRYEPWAVVIHEAAYSQIPVICTWVCGASTRLVLDGYNGVVISPDDPSALSFAFARISQATDDERRQMGAASGSLARQYSPARWAETILLRLPALREASGLPPRPWVRRSQAS